MPLKEVDSLWKINKYNRVFMLSVTIFFLFVIFFSFNNYDQNEITGFASVSNYSIGGCSDLDNDGRVSIGDLNVMQENIGKTSQDKDFNEQLDFDKNNIINQADLTCLQSDFGKQIKCPKHSKSCGCLQGCYDLNKDGEVSVLDLAILSKKSGKCVDDASYDTNADFDGDGCISSHQLSHDYLCLYNNLGLKDIKCGYDNTIGGCSDFDNDKISSEKDYSYISQLRGTQKNNPNYDPKADYNYDGRIDDIDIACFNEDEGYNIRCPEDSRYCGCFNGCPDLNGDELVTTKDLDYFNQIIGVCKGNPNYDENADFDKDNCIEGHEAELDYLCISYNIGKKSFCKVKQSDSLIVKDVKSASIKIVEKTSTKLNFKTINDDLLGSLNLRNSLFVDGVKVITEKPFYIEITGDKPSFSEGTLKIVDEETNLNLYLPNIDKTPIVLFFNKEGNSFYDSSLNKPAANIDTKYISDYEEIKYSQPKCNGIKCISIQLISDYYIHLLVITSIIIITHYIHKKKYL